jgi:hypothetical protein
MFTAPRGGIARKGGAIHVVNGIIVASVAVEVPQ